MRTNKPAHLAKISRYGRETEHTRRTTRPAFLAGPRNTGHNHPTPVRGCPLCIRFHAPSSLASRL